MPELKFGSVIEANAGEKHDAQAIPISTCNVKWVKPGTWATKESTCSRLGMRLGMDYVPIGVMREKGVPHAARGLHDDR